MKSATRTLKPNNKIKQRAPKYYWKDWNNVEKTIRLIIKSLKHFPTQSEIIGLGYSTLAFAISKYHGGIFVVREKLGYEAHQRPPGYWKNFENIRRELEPMIEEGEYPSQRELLDQGYTGLVSAIGKNFGGWSAVRERLGGRALVKPKDYWTEWKHVKTALLELTERLGHFPFSVDFRKSEYSRLPGAIAEFHGGMGAVRSRLGHHSSRTPKGYWKDFKNVKAAIEDLEEKLGHFPTSREMYESEYPSLPSAIANYHESVAQVAERLGKQTALRPKGHWTLRRVKELCAEFVEEYEHFPKAKELNRRDDKYRGLNSGINKNGGIARIRKLLGIKLDKKPDGYWNEDQIVREARVLVKRYGRLPTQKELNAMGHTDFVGAIGVHSSFRALRTKLGLEVLKHENGYWTEKRIIEECQRVVDTEGDLPAKGRLNELDLGALAGQIERSGGYPYFRKKLGLRARRAGIRTWTKEYTYQQAERLYEEFGTIPTESKLFEIGMATLPNAAGQHYGGLVALRELLREAHGESNPDEQLKDLAYIHQELRRIQEEQGLHHPPGQETLRKLGYNRIIYGIKKYHGGLNKVRSSLGAKAVSPNGTWRDSKAVLREARKLMQDHQFESWPAESKLRELGYSMLPNAIRNCFGSINNFREALGEKVVLRVSKNSWKNLDFVVEEARRVMEELRLEELPPQLVLYKNGYSSLSQAISMYHGGFPKFRELLRQRLEENSSDHLRATLEHYVGAP